jgi:hypothetical protein
LERTISVKVFPRSGRNEVKPSGGVLKVYITAPPAGGKANEALVEALAEYLDVRRSRVRIVKGARSREKTVRIS